MRVGESLRFLRRFLAHPRQIGAVAPSSGFLARALVQPLSRHERPANILELGAGSGAVTRHIVPLVGPDDRLDICEADPQLAGHIRDEYLVRGRLAEQFQVGRVRLWDQYLQDVPELLEYDFVISGLPLNAFCLRDIKTILDILKRQAAPGCVLSYFEYIGLRSLTAAVRLGESRKQARYRSAYLRRQISNYQFERRSVLLNIPPACARHLRIGAAA